MSRSNTREAFGIAAQRDEINEGKRAGFQKYISPWVHIDAAGSYNFAHGLGDIPHVADVLVASSPQGLGAAQGSSFSIEKTATLVTVTNSGTARFFRVRAF